VDAKYEFEVVHRQFVGLAREFDSTEAKLGVIALAAVALMPVYFSDPRALSDRILEVCLATSATVAALGFMLFRGYDAFVPLEFQRACRAEPRLALRHYCDKMVGTYQANRKAIRAKKIAAWTSIALIAAVIGIVSILRVVYSR
jgi:hypothetical protein